MGSHPFQAKQRGRASFWPRYALRLSSFKVNTPETTAHWLGAITIELSRGKTTPAAFILHPTRDQQIIPFMWEGVLRSWVEKRACEGSRYTLRGCSVLLLSLDIYECGLMPLGADLQSSQS
jgi:hypothetical protein